MPIVRPLRPCLARLAQSSSAIRVRAAVSSPCRLCPRRMCAPGTRRPPCAQPPRRRRVRSARAGRGPAEVLPKRSTSTSGSILRHLPSVATPSSERRVAVLGPMPGISDGGLSAKRAQACSRVSTTNPAGFSASEATFAMSLFGPIPTEQVNCVAPRSRRSGGASPRAASRAPRDRGRPRRGRRPRPVSTGRALCHHLCGGFAVGGEVRRQEHRLRAQAPRA